MPTRSMVTSAIIEMAAFRGANLSLPWPEAAAESPAHGPEPRAGHGRAPGSGASEDQSLGSQCQPAAPSAERLVELPDTLAAPTSERRPLRLGIGRSITS